jgi:DNA repair exonuclease SbcCD nuclease subunit
MKILHTADWHIGALRQIPNYLQRQEDALKELCEKTKGISPDVFIVTGDIYNSYSPTEEERNLILSTLTRLLLENPNMRMILIGGNHDWNKQEMSMLDGISISYAIAGTRFSVVCNNPKVISIDDCNFFCVPCQQNLTKQKVKRLVKKVHRENKNGSFYVCMHECFKSFNDFGKELGKESLPRLKFVKYWMLGDIHKHQYILDNAWYCGSLLQVNFGETSKKGFVVIDEDEVTFHSIKSPKRLVEIRQGEDVPKNCYVKYKITDLEKVNKNELPSNVVQFDTDIKPKAVDVSLISGGMTEGLAEFMATRFGYSEKMQKKSVDYIKSLNAG